jgi:aspartyl-tRNA(Asn)/glutamyl-tRNA(Gln) amidotransferase subunit C
VSITPDEVLRVAELAELDVAPGDLARLVAELDQIVAYVGRLSALGGSETAPPFEPGPPAITLHPDVVGSVPLARPPAELAPDWRDGFFIVPRLSAMDAE